MQRSHRRVCNSSTNQQYRTQASNPRQWRYQLQARQCSGRPCTRWLSPSQALAPLRRSCPVAFLPLPANTAPPRRTSCDTSTTNRTHSSTTPPRLQPHKRASYPHLPGSFPSSHVPTPSTTCRSSRPKPSAWPPRLGNTCLQTPTCEASRNGTLTRPRSSTPMPAGLPIQP